jgi:hypothetical protein
MRQSQIRVRNVPLSLLQPLDSARSLGRVALRDDIVPFEKPFTDIHGVVHDTLRCVRTISL